MRPAHTGSRRRAVQITLAVLALVATALLMQPPSATAFHPTRVTVTIVSVDGVGGDLDGVGRDDADFYAGVEFDRGTVLARRIAGNSFSSHVDDDPSIRPFWPISDTVEPATVNGVPTGWLTLSIWDHDDCDQPFCTDTGAFESDDDQLDIKSGDGETVALDIDLTTGKWTGDVSWPTNCATGNGGEGVKVCFDISIDSASGDADADGLLDGWERSGYNDNGDSAIDVDLPALGADPLHKDLFLELDYTIGETPERQDILAMKRAMAAAPLTNPDGRNGVNLWVDTGTLADPNAREGQARGTCSDGVDNGGDGRTDGNEPECEYLDASVEDPAPSDCSDGDDDDGDGLTDVQDPDCLVGDNLGGGNAVPALNNCGLDRVFYDTKNAPGNFAPARRELFRYAISTSNEPDTDGPGPDTGCQSGGQGEIGGNDFIEFNHDGGTILHELGHNLNLRHGGFEDTNCKPNYVSSMNYDLQFGIPRAGGGTIIDYSPPRVALDGSTRGLAPLGPLAEQDLDETTPLDATDNQNRFAYVDATGQKRTTTLSARPDWAGDGSPPDNPGVSANVDTSSPDNPATTADERNPVACANNTAQAIHTGSHDWNRVTLPFRQWAESADSAVNPEEHPLPTLAELERLWDLLNTADLSVTLTDNPDPVAAGETLTWTATLVNNGPNPATSAELFVDQLPTGWDEIDMPTPCLRVSAGTAIRCNVGELLPGRSTTVTLAASVPADAVYDNGGPFTVTPRARVTNLAGPDSDPLDNSDTETTRVYAKADVAVTAVGASAPAEALIGEPATVPLQLTIGNLGPSSPVDTTLTTTSTADPGLTVSPATSTTDQPALVGTRQVTSAVTLSCVTPGVKTVSLTARLALAEPEDVDPDLTNNARTVTFSIDCVVPIAINVRPGGFPNSVNLRTDATLAALTTTAGEYGLPLDFDALSIDVSTTRWGLRAHLFNAATPMGAAEIHDTGHPERSYELDDRTRDADLDLVLHFKPSDSGLAAESTEACLKGRYVAPDQNVYTYLGCDSVRVVSR